MHDQTEVGSRGINLSGGQRQRVALARALFTRSKILVLDDPFSALDGETKHEIIHNLFGPKGLLRSMGVTVFLVSHATDSFHLADHILVLGNSGILAQGPWSKIKATYGNIADIIHERQKAESTDKFQQVSTVDVSQRLVADKEADLSRKTGDIAIYAYYLRSIGKTNCSILVLCCSAYAFAVIFPQYWLKWWTEADGADMWFYVGGYAFLSFTAWLSTSMITWLTYIRIAPQSGASLHSGLLKTIFGAQLSYFFIADTGTILNRFGQDIQMVDRDIPNTLAGLGVQIFRMIMQAALLLSVQRLLALTLPICMAIIYILQKFYLQTSRQLRLLELESRAAVYSSFLETVDGLTTIRAMGWQEEYSEQNDHCLDEFQRPTYLLFCLQRWLNVVLNLMVAGIAVVVIAITVLYQSSSSGAEIGISLNIILVTNTTLLRLVDFWTTLEISLGAVARLKNLESETPQELDEIKTVEPDAAWPRDGSCEIRDVQVSYNSRAIALRNVNISISGGQKVLICGKTGSGKSTLFLALLRLLELQKGFIKVDGVDISHVPRSTIRERCFITMPQDTYISPNGSLRSNLDFYAEYTDEQIISALTRTQLWHHVSGPSRQSSNVDTPPTDFAILSLSMADLPPLSFGQMQLFALTRALLRSYEPTAHNGVQRPKPTLLLDEATSSLDEDSEELIHRLIDESFTAKGFTVIVIAHRIAAAAKWMRAGQDLVVRMDRGTVEEVKVFDGQI